MTLGEARRRGMLLWTGNFLGKSISRASSMGCARSLGWELNKALPGAAVQGQAATEALVASLNLVFP